MLVGIYTTITVIREATFVSLLNEFICLFFFFRFYVISTFVNYLIKVKLVTIVKGDLKAPFSIASTPRCRGGSYSFAWIAPL